VDFGVNFFPVVDPARLSAAQYYADALALSELADELGYEHVQFVEHFGSSYGGYSPDPIALLCAVAVRTSRVRLVTGAVIPAFAHPIQLASSLAMLDNLSGGRLDVGFGRAFLPAEFTAFGVSMDSSRARFEEGISACVALWTGEDVVFDGEFHRFGPFTTYPRPLQQPHPPVLVASATSPESCAAAGRAGHHLQVVPSVTSPEGLLAMLSAYRAGRQEAGHGPGRVQVKYTCYLAADRDQALTDARANEENYVRRMADAVADWATTRSDQYPGYEKFVEKARAYDFDASLAARKVLAGTAEDVRGQIADVRDRCGSDLCLSLQFNPGHLPRERAAAAMRLFAAEVAPAFAGAGVPAGALAG
jgi:alkanesulfonate monooxygenase SsuD/methylene tetrahydromethanopterin reductase-like flavin-dependent oxidoreductase (luciferase family)